MNIRPLSFNDIEALITFFSDVAIRTESFIVRTPAEYRSDYIEKLISDVNSAGVGFIMEDKDELAGIIYAQRKEPMRFHHVLTDLTIAVNPDAQGVGLGRRLFNHLISHVEEETDFKRIELFTSAENERGIEFYKSLGFDVEGRFNKRIKYLDDKYHDDIAMAWLKSEIKSLG